MKPLILHNGIIHSPTDPYATALLVEDGMIAWLGSEETHTQIAPEAERVDLEGAVVAPLFVDPLVLAASDLDDSATMHGENGALARGVGTITVLAAGGTSGQRSCSPAPMTLLYRDLDAVATGALGVWVPTDELSQTDVNEVLVQAVQAGEQPYLAPSAGHDPQARAQAQRRSLTALRAAEQRLGVPALGRVRPRLVLDGRLDDEDTALLGATASSVTVMPSQGRLDAPIGSLLAAGVPVCLGSEPGTSPWEAMQAALHHPEPAERVSARSAFAACTRAGLRAAAAGPSVHAAPPTRLAVSAAADLAVWRADAVGVQAPDSRVAAWSTDTRAGTPLLPDLEDGAAPPRLIATLAAGRTVCGSLTSA